MRWVQAGSGNVKGEPPLARSGHTAAHIAGKLVVFGGLHEKQFLNDVVVLELDTQTWTRPLCVGTIDSPDTTEEEVPSHSVNEGLGRVPGPRAFHVAVVVESRLLFVFGGRSGRDRLSELWVLDTATWQWSQPRTTGSNPVAREFAAGAALGNRVLVYGGWDGNALLSDVHILDTVSMTWSLLQVSSPAPPARRGHSAVMLERRLLIFGGTGGSMGSLNDLWALKGLYGEEPAAWTRLQLGGTVPSGRTGHSIVVAGPRLLFFGGHGVTGWLSKQQVYYNECVVLDRETVKWGRISTNEPPSQRAYHTMTAIGSRRLLVFGGFDGRACFGDSWWLLSEDEAWRPGLTWTTPVEPGILVPVADGLGKRPSPVKGRQESEVTNSADVNQAASQPQEGDRAAIVKSSVGVEYSALLLPIGQRLTGEEQQQQDEQLLSIARSYLSACNAADIRLGDLEALLADYQCLALSKRLDRENEMSATALRRFSHFSPASIRMSDVQPLLAGYQQLLSMR
eukprot:jgi/Chlat1/8299/Chrsp78S07714